MYPTLCQRVDSLYLNNYANVLLLITFSEFCTPPKSALSMVLNPIRFKIGLVNHVYVVIVVNPLTTDLNKKDPGPPIQDALRGLGGEGTSIDDVTSNGLVNPPD